jgi:hypothetical protein
MTITESDTPTSYGPSPELRAKREAKLRIHLNGETDMDADTVLSTMVDPPTYELASIDLVLRGKDQVKQLLELMFNFLPGIVHRAVKFHHADDNVIVEVETDFPNGLAGDTPGQVVTLKSVGIFPFDGETSLGEKVYSDMSPIAPHLNFDKAPE